MADMFFDDLQEPEKIKIAVVLPVYNTRVYLRECIESLLKQTHTNFVVFAVDDGLIIAAGKIRDNHPLGDGKNIPQPVVPQEDP